MTPKELATHFPRLYHVTEPGAWENIKKHGLLSTNHILNWYDIDASRRLVLETQRRPTPTLLEHHQYGQIVLNDNIPLSESALRGCLDDNLVPADWFLMLNKRVFFWPNTENLDRHLQARLNRNRLREIIVVDTLALAQAYAAQMELSPINSGATLRKAARRGLKTFAPLLQYSFKEWRKLRGYNDNVREITVLGAVNNMADFTIEVYQTNTLAT